MRIVYCGACFAHGKIHAVVNVKRGKLRLAHAGVAHVRLVRYYKRGGNRAHRHPRAFIVVTYGGNYFCYVLRIRAKAIKYPERHYRAALRVVNAVYNVAYVVHIGCYLRKLYLPLVVAQCGKYICGHVRRFANVGKAVLREPKLAQRRVRHADISLNGRVGLYLLKSYH